MHIATFATFIAAASAAAILPGKAITNSTTDGTTLVLLGDCTIANSTKTSAAVLYQNFGMNNTATARGKIEGNGTFHDWDNATPFTVGFGDAMLQVQLMEEAASGANEFDVVGSGVLSMMNSTAVRDQREIELSCVKAPEEEFQVAKGVECVSRVYCGDGTGQQQQPPKDE